MRSHSGRIVYGRVPGASSNEGAGHLFYLRLTASYML